MATRALREFDGKHILSRWITEYSRGNFQVDDRLVHIAGTNRSELNFDKLESENPWLTTEQLVVKPDQRIKRRGKSGLLLLNATWEEAKLWIADRAGKPVIVEGVTGILEHFLVEPFVAHESSDEYYLCLQSLRDGDEILFHPEGGVDVGDVDAKALRLCVPVDGSVSSEEVSEALLAGVPEARRARLAAFIRALLELFVELHFAYLEINPLVVLPDGAVLPLDLAATVDEAAAFLVRDKWAAASELQFPPPFGRPLTAEEQYVHDLDSKTGASLKLTLLNAAGRVWTMVAGGGASVVYADTISDLGFGQELANYGEYSGAPSEALTYEYARTILGLMTRQPCPDGRPKVLIVGGGIANFTDVAKTFSGIVHALTDYAQALQRCGVRVWVRRGGPNYQEGLRMMRELGKTIGVPISVHGPETHITAIVPMALRYAAGEEEEEEGTALARQPSLSFDYSSGGGDSGAEVAPPGPLLTPVTPREVKVDVAGSVAAASGGKEGKQSAFCVAEDASATYNLFSSGTRALVYGMQLKAVQGMLDFDFLCKRTLPSVAAIIFPFSGNHNQKFYYGTQEILIPVMTRTEDALLKFPDVTVLVNFASFRSAFSSTREALRHSQLRSIAVIAEGVPERQTRSLIREANAKGVSLIGPATVGGIKPGCFRVGNTGGMLDNVLMSRLYRPGSVAYVSKSGGMSNELNNIISRNSDGVFEGVAIGGDRYPGSRFIDHLLRFQDNPNVAMLVLLGEVGGQDEYDVCAALRSGRITKPLVAWCIGTCAKVFPFEVQFGHAGALARGRLETADAKNLALRQAGAVVPPTFDAFNSAIADTFAQLCASGAVTVRPEPEQPKVPMDYKWAKELGLVRKPTSFVSSICDDRGEELLYAGMPISQVFGEDLGVGGVLSLLWFRRRLPIYAAKFIEMVLMVTADHGPAVSGAHNTIVSARAGKDLISSLCSGLLTIGPRFGGALDAAATDFSEACYSGVTPRAFVTSMRAQHRLIMGIGHRVKSVENPDMRVTLIVEYAKKHFPATPVLDFALGVEAVTTRKKSNLILNVDGAIACCFVDLLRGCGAFDTAEADELIANGCLNGLFVLGRSIGFIGHYLDQKRLKQGLYRHPWDDISYLNADD